MTEFPAYDFNESSSKSNHREHKLVQQSSEGNIPEIFLLGGNKELNLALYHQRQSKLSKISLS
jgi:hypothetical protein